MGYLDVGGQRVWHEVDGEGPSLVLLHGAFGTADSFGPLGDELRGSGFRTYVPERRAHGRTADVPGPISYELMARDTIVYLEQEVLPDSGPAHLVGWSDGAAVAIEVSLARPDLVARQVLIGQYLSSDGKVDEDRIETMMTAPEVVAFFRAGYEPLSPDGPEHFDVVYDKILAMVRTEPEIDLRRLADVPTPTLVLQGDRDEVRLDHSRAVVDAMADARLAVLPGSHGLPLELPHVVAALVTAFLRGEPSHELF